MKIVELITELKVIKVDLQLVEENHNLQLESTLDRVDYVINELTAERLRNRTAKCKS